VDAVDPQLFDDVTADSPVEPDVAPPAAPAQRPSGLDDVAPTGARRRRRRRSATRNAVEWAIVLVGALVVALVVKTWLFQAFYIPSSSMEPALEIGDRVLVNKVSYDIGDVRRGHIVVFERPENWTTGDIEDLIKRVVALPGDTISAENGVVIVNGEALDEEYLTADNRNLTRFEPASGCVPQCTLGPNEIFVLGDNRENSSASNVYGPIDFGAVVGRAFIRVWPLSEFGGI
jgi:signal peptidase I